MRIGVEVRPFNYNLRSRRLEWGYTQKQLAEEAQVQTELIGKLERLIMPPNGTKIKILREKMNRIAIVLESDFNWLFPQDYLDAIQHKLLPRRKGPIIWVSDVNILQIEHDELYALPSAEDEVIELDIQGSIKNSVHHLLTKLSPREKGVIEFRFGIDCEAHNLDDCASEFGVTRERIRQIEAKALRKLKHPIRSRSLRELI